MSVNGLLRTVQGISSTTQGGEDVLGRLSSGSYWAQLRPASFRGIPFGVFEGSASFGRRNAVHEYPFRDKPWVEDLGRSARRIQVSGFLVGDDVIARRDKMIAKAEQAGDGELVHPTLGKRKVALIDFSCREIWDQGRVFALSFVFIEQGERQFPSAGGAGQPQITAESALTDTQAAAAFVKRTLAALKSGAAAANEAASQASAWAGVALQASRDATSLVNLASTLPGEFGRLLGQSSGVKVGQVVAVTAGLTAADLKGVAASSRGQVDASAAALSAAGQGLGPTSAGDFAAAAQALAQSVRETAATPGDAVRALSAMAAFVPEGQVTGASAVTQGETVLLLQRAAVAALARAGAEYQPSSSEDAVLVRETVLSAVDAQILAAGDRGDDDVFKQLRALRAAAVADLNVRGAELPELQTVNTPSSLPALVLAQRLYRDAARADDLVQRAKPVHPAFMPLSFKALSS